MTYRIDEIQGRRGKPAILLRRHWREGKRIRKQTVANLTRHPGWLAEGIRSVVDAGTGRAGRAGTVEIRRSLPHGHAAAILGTLKSLGFERILAREDSRNRRNRRIALAAVAARIADPLSKLATSRLLSEGTASSSLGALLGLGEVSGNEVLAMLDWLLGAPALDRAEPREPAPGGGCADPLRPELELCRGAQDPAVRLRLQPRRPAGQEADHLRASVRPRGMPGRDRSVRRQRVRSVDGGPADRQDPPPLRPRAGRLGGRPRHDHERAHPRRAALRRASTGSPR